MFRREKCLKIIRSEICPFFFNQYRLRFKIRCEFIEARIAAPGFSGERVSQELWCGFGEARDGFCG